MSGEFSFTFMSPGSRATIRKNLQRLGAVGSFLDFSRGLHHCGITLECIECPGPASFQLALAAKGVARGFHSFGLERVVAGWMQRWDDVDYEIPLSPQVQKFLAARDEWLRWSGHAHDLPRSRWNTFAEIVCRLWPESWPNVMAACFGSETVTSYWVQEAALRLGIEPSDVRSVFGPV